MSQKETNWIDNALLAASGWPVEAPAEFNRDRYYGKRLTGTRRAHAATAATDGTILLFVAGYHPGAPIESSLPVSAWKMEENTPSRPIDAKRLLAWAKGGALELTESDCPECSGAATVMCRDCLGNARCSHCNKGDCPECEGEGTVDCECVDGLKRKFVPHAITPGALLGGFLNRGLLWRVLQHLPAEWIEVGRGDHKDDLFLFRGPGWELVMGPLSDDIRDAAPVVAFEAEGASDE